MSSWERVRYIPWDRIPTRTGTVSTEYDLDQTRERIFRELHKEAIERQIQKQQQEQQVVVLGNKDENNLGTPTNGTAVMDAANAVQQSTTTTTMDITPPTNKILIPYSHMDLARNAAFGVTLGSITGSLFGFLDGMKSVGESTVLQKASNGAQLKYIVQGTTRTGLLFGTFFGGYQCMKYFVRIYGTDPGDVTEIAVATPLALSALYYKPTYRPAVRYGYMLIGMDCFSTYMRRTSSSS